MEPFDPNNAPQLSEQQKEQLRRDLYALEKRLAKIHAIRTDINEHFAHIDRSNYTTALTQKKNLQNLRREYEQLEKEAVKCLEPADAAVVLEQEYNYILTVDNILTTTRELKRNAPIGEENREAIMSGLEQFYNGLRAELVADRKEREARQKLN